MAKKIVKIYYYARCSTCQKALKFLESNVPSTMKIEVHEMSELNAELLKDIYKRSNLDIKKFCNTSGIDYRKDDITSYLKEDRSNIDEFIEKLASNWKYIKRPIIDFGDYVTTGYLGTSILEGIKD